MPTRLIHSSIGLVGKETFFAIVGSILIGASCDLTYNTHPRILIALNLAGSSL
ncbi:hypothetical protein ACSYAD_31410 [Acaryochloris marina NIES-2412]|uniref:hypothetical protein n=1 Tax=Acaryochloris marina TaxID=155978 RepID=UPI0040597571